MARSRTNKTKETNPGLIQEPLPSHSSEEEFYFGQAMIAHETIKGFGQETKASTSRINPGGRSQTNSEVSPYYHIQNAANPFSRDGVCMSAKEAIELCQKAFYSFPSFRNPIVMQSYLANSPIHFTKAKPKVITFFNEWSKKVNIWDVANQFFMEWFRSGNIFMYKFEGDITLKEAKKIAAKTAEARNRKIPLKYVLLNPADIQALGSSSFNDQIYGKVLNAYEAEMVKRQETEEDKKIYDSLDQEAKDQLNSGGQVIIKLDPKKMRLAFNAKQSYEPMSIPPYFGVLEPINFKQTLRAAETKVAASADYCILLVTAGEQGGGTRNAKVLASLQQLFSAQSVGRVLFADYTAEANFIIPDLNKIFGPEKYVTVDQDIMNGMNDIMSKDESFATGQTKTKIYLQLLSQARESFLNFFLIPELQKIAEEMGFDEIPIPNFEEVTLDSLNESKKLYNRLYELGALTAGELFHAYETDQLPNDETSLESQKAFKSQKKSGLYEPLIGGAQDPAGRPGGSTQKKTVRTVGPKGGKASLAKIKETLPKMNDLSERLALAYKEKNGLSRLSKNHREVVDALFEKVVISEPIENWATAALEFIENPLRDESGSQYDEVFELAEAHQISTLSAAILYHSQDREK